MSQSQTTNINYSQYPDDLDRQYIAFMEMFISKERAIEYMRIEEVNPVWFSIFGAVIGIIASFSLIVNSGIVIVFNRAFRRSRTRFMNCNLLFLAISDLGMCLVGLGFTLHACIHHGWQLGVLACKLDGFFGGFFAFLQISTLCEIALQRYTVVKTINSTINIRTEILRLICVFIISLVIAGLPFTGFGRFMLEGIHVSCTFNYIETDPINLGFVVFINIVGLVVPCSVITFSYVNILRICKVSGHKVSGTKSGHQRQRELFKKREMRLAKRAVLCLLLFFVTWAPHSFISIFSQAGFHVPHLIATIAVCIAKASTAVNGTFYVAKHPDVSKELLRRFLPCLLSKNNEETRLSVSADRFLSKQEPSVVQRSTCAD